MVGNGFRDVDTPPYGSRYAAAGSHHSQPRRVALVDRPVAETPRCRRQTHQTFTARPCGGRSGRTRRMHIMTEEQLDARRALQESLDLRD
ncbi:hypothetical protein GCM10027070_08400 [Barrientosiimonas humi]